MLVEVDVDFLVEHGMTFEQYALCYFLYEDEKDIVGGKRKYPESGPKIANIYKYLQNVRPWPKDDIIDLIEGGYLDHTGDRLSPDLLEPTDKFKKAVFKHLDAFDQLFELYPKYMSFGPGKPKARLKACDRPALEKYYNKVVRTKKKHKRILSITKWAKENDMLKMSITKFVKGKYWEVLEEEYEQNATEDIKDQEQLI